MSTTLRVLIIEDSEDDTKLLLQALRRGSWQVQYERVDTPEGMAAALGKQEWDLLIADHSMPQFSGPAALALALEYGCEAPFILISGVVDEETAVLSMKAGADDYISKGKLDRLLPAVERELRTADERRTAKRTELRLRARELHLAEALQLAGIGTWHLDFKTGVVTWSDRACQILEFPIDAAPADFSALLARIAPQDRIAFADCIRNPATSNFSQDVQLIRAKGALQFVQISGEVIRDNNAASVEAAGMIQDISERCRLNRELAAAKEAAEAANRAKSEFLANMSHEIRTPMTAIVGFSQMLLNRSPDACETIDCVQIIQRSSMHLLDLINEILDLSKIEAGEMAVERIPCDVPSLISEVIAIMRPRAAEKGLTFDVAFKGAIPAVIQSDPTRLRQILINLLGNATKFTKAGTVTMRITDEGEGGPNIALRVDVIDTGIGMSPGLLAHLFRPFTQGDESITRKFGGTGLGLTISQRFARMLQGDISVTSEVGVGSTFTLIVDGGPSAGVQRLANLTEADLPTLLSQQASAGTRIQGHVLLVEDGRDNQRLMRMYLTDAGAEVTTAENGQIAVDLATAQSFDLILMDMQMPVMDGYAATTELRRRGIKVPILALTAYAMADDRGKCISCGCTDYLTKPINEETLLNTIKRHLELNPAAEQNASLPAPTSAAAPAGSAGGTDRIKSTFADNPRMMKIIPEFVQGLASEVEKLDDLLRKQDLPALQRVAHQLVGACGGYGFDILSDPARKVEASIKAGEPINQISEKINVLKGLISRVDGYAASSTSGRQAA